MGVVTLKLSRGAFAFIIAVVSAGGTLLASLAPLYLPPNLAVPIVTFSTALIAAGIVYLGTEEQKAPP